MTRLTAILAVLAAALGGTAAYAQAHHGHTGAPKQAAVRPAVRHANAWSAAASTATTDLGQAAQGQPEPGDDSGQEMQGQPEPGDDSGQQAAGQDDSSGAAQNQGAGADDGSNDGGQGSSGHGDDGSDG